MSALTYLFQEIKNQVDVLMIQNLEAKLSETILRNALHFGIPVMLLNPHIMQAQLSEIQTKSGNYVFFYMKDNVVHMACNDYSTCLERVLQEIKEDSLKEHAITNLSYPWQENEVALISFSSGSTGRPKGVRHSLQNVVRAAELFVSHFGIKKDDVILSLAPVHVMCARMLIINILGFSKVHFIDKGPFNWYPAIEQYQPKYIVCGPLFIEGSLKSNIHLQSLLSNRIFLCTGAHLDSQKRDIFENLYPGSKVLNFYGLTETGIVLAENHFARRSHLLPEPCQGVQIKLNLFTEDGTDTLYELSVISPNLFLGYFDEPIEKKLIYNTGDLVKQSKHGLELVGRKNRSFKMKNGTSFIYPELLESWLKTQKGINDAYVCPKSKEQMRATCYIDHAMINKQDLLDKTITSLGKEYGNFCFISAKIRRTSFGKINGIEIENT